MRYSGFFVAADHRRDLRARKTSAHDWVRVFSGRVDWETAMPITIWDAPVRICHWLLALPVFAPAVFLAGLAFRFWIT